VYRNINHQAWRNNALTKYQHGVSASAAHQHRKSESGGNGIVSA